MKTRKNLLSLLLVAAAVGIFVLLKATRPEPAVATAQETRFSVRTEVVSPARIQPELALIAAADSANRPTMVAAVTAEVLQVLAREGQRVARGELLIALDPRDADVAHAQAQAELAQAEANLRLEQAQAQAQRDDLARERQMAQLSEAELARQVRMRTRGVVSETALDQGKQNHQRALQTLASREQAVALQPAREQQARAQLAAAEARLQAAELQLERTEIRAPFDAVVTNVLVEEGARVVVGQTLIALYDVTGVEMVADVPTRHLGDLQATLDAGQPARATAEYAGQTLHLVLRRLGGESRGGAVQAWFGLRGDTPVPMGLRLPLQVELGAVDAAVVVPESGLYDLSRIFRVVDGRLESLRVRVHGRRGTGVVITHPDLQDGDVILTTHLANASSGLAVSLIEQDAP